MLNRLIPPLIPAPTRSGETVHRRLPQGAAPGSRDRDYRVHIPPLPKVRKRRRPPGLVMVLHGCDQTVNALIRTTRFIEQAEARGCVVVFPAVTSWSRWPQRARNCWGFWIEAERQRHAGEIGDLMRIFEAVEAEFGTDPRRRCIAGLSSGGAMAVAVAAVHADAILAAGAVAGLAYGETSAAVTAPSPFDALKPWFLSEPSGQREPRLRPFPALVQDMALARETAGVDRIVPLLVIQSSHDTVVQLENAQMLRDVWRGRNDRTGGIATAPATASTASPADGHRRYTDSDGNTLVETLFYEGRKTDPTHYWPGDAEALPYASLDGPSATDALLDFFQREGL